MKKSLLLLISCSIFSSCTVTLGEPAEPSKKSSQEMVEEMCEKGNAQACEVLDERQKKKDEKNQKIIKESGIRSK